MGKEPGGTERISRILTRLAAETGPDPTLGEILHALSYHGFGAAMLLFTAPNLIPLPPGTSSILSVPLLFITAQLAFGRSSIWLPRRLAARHINRQTLRTLDEKITPLLDYAGRLFKARAGILILFAAERLIGVVCFLLSIILVIPIPFGHQLPALVICLFALAIIARDGYAAALAWLVLAISVIIILLLSDVIATSITSHGRELFK